MKEKKERKAGEEKRRFKWGLNADRKQDQRLYRRRTSIGVARKSLVYRESRYYIAKYVFPIILCSTKMSAFTNVLFSVQVLYETGMKERFTQKRGEEKKYG